MIDDCARGMGGLLGEWEGARGFLVGWECCYGVANVESVVVGGDGRVANVESVVVGGGWDGC